MSETARRTSKGQKNWRLVHFRRSKGEARRAEPTIGLCFRAEGAERGEWRGPKGRADAFDIVVLWRKDARAASL